MCAKNILACFMFVAFVVGLFASFKREKVKIISCCKETDVLYAVKFEKHCISV